MGPPVPITARTHSTPQSCANNGKDALNTPDKLSYHILLYSPGNHGVVRMVPVPITAARAHAP
eukprot:8216127-Pyramimonas_sp.AAC.1